MSNPLPILTTNKLTKAFGEFIALKDVSLDLMKGERRALIGPNGAGKSTFISAIGGQSANVQGQVLFKGKDVTGSQPFEMARHGVGRTFQISRAYLHLSVLENMVSALCVSKGRWFSLRAQSLAELNDQAWSLLEDVGLTEHAKLTVEDISLGDRKRLEFGMVLAGDPELLMLDEPTAGMSLTERHHLMDLVTELVERTNKTLLFVEHDIDVVFKVAQKITVMVRGQILVEGTPEEIAANQEVQNVYLGEGHN